MSKEKSKKELHREAARRSKMLRRVRNWAIGLGITGLAIYGLVLLTQIGGPEGPDYSQSVPIMRDLTHIPEGGSEEVEYNSNPPTSGPHYARTAQFGFREEQISDGHLIHNLEHGDIWISFHPDIPEEIKDDLRNWYNGLQTRTSSQSGIALGIQTAFASDQESAQSGERLANHLPWQREESVERRAPRINYQKVLITPREENETDIAVAAWGRLDTFDLEEVGGVLPTQRIEDFILRYMYGGPEDIRGPSGGI